jgi:peptidoglycan hydrolase-like protein with peptidoglycan-binding domain
LSPGSAPANLLLGFLLPGTTVVDVSRLPVLRLGATESAVRLLQLELNVTGASPELTPDSNFGRKTDKAVRAFQQRQDLVVDGVVGPNTWAKLDKEVQSRATPTLDRSPPTDVSV